MDLDVPELVRRRAVTSGPAGRAWLDALPDVVAALAARWGLTLGRAFEGGTAERVSTGLANLRDLGDDEGRQFLEVARRCL